MVANSNMQQQLVPRLARSSHSFASFPRVSIGLIEATVKDEETIEHILGENAFENTNLDLDLQVDTK
jgi:hypothetical protein